ncbi:MAG: MCE family protein [Rhodospirillaceae bacterium]|nr:MCE family protein [Rhodospirillaceae bacterium]
MPKAERRETLVGILALLVIVTVFVFTALGNRVKERNQTTGPQYVAAFNRADGLHEGADVRLAGVKIGVVGNVDLDERFRAVMMLDLNQNIPLPDDTAALIETDGVFGGKYVELQPGGSMDMLKPGARIGYTQDSVILEDLIVKIVEQAKAATKKPVAESQTSPQ